MLDKAYREFYEAKALTYPAHDAPSIVRYEKALTLAGLTAGLRVLDLACKDAVLLSVLESRDLDTPYTGVDISARVVERNRALRPHAHFLQADILAGLPLPDASFDRVFALEILEHVPEPTRLLAEAHRLLAPEGRLLLSVPNPYYYTEFINELRGASDTEGHLYAFRDSNLRALLELCGFRVQGVVGTYLQIPRQLRGAFRDHAFWLVRDVPPLLARSRVYCCTDVLTAAPR